MDHHTRSPGVDVYCDTAGEWHWTAHTADGRTLADGADGHGTSVSAQIQAVQVLGMLLKCPRLTVEPTLSAWLGDLDPATADAIAATAARLREVRTENRRSLPDLDGRDLDDETDLDEECDVEARVGARRGAVLLAAPRPAMPRPPAPRPPVERPASAPAPAAAKRPTRRPGDSGIPGYDPWSRPISV